MLGHKIIIGGCGRAAGYPSGFFAGIELQWLSVTSHVVVDCAGAKSVEPPLDNRCQERPIGDR